ncbi:MAG: thiolase family protein [Nocardioidaceae bacterium]|nr:thiolase family protein [Nocardioidaceae bacterium]
MLGRDVFVVDAVRTPIGKAGGAYADVRPDDLAAHAVRSIVDRAGDALGADGGAVDEVVLGAANQAGEDNRNVGRMSVLLAGLPTSVTGSTVNRLCASGLDAVMQGARAIAVGEADLMIAGGVESMTRAPWVLPKPSRRYPVGHEQLWSTTLGWRMVNPEMPGAWTVSLGEATEILRERHGITREAADAFAVRSHELAIRAWEDGLYADEVAPYAGVELARDETIREGVTTESLARLKPVFREDGTVTAGNASPLNDGSAALLLADADTVERRGLRPLARIVSTGAHGVDPEVFGIGPVEAVRTALRRAGKGLEDVDVLELNEAFAAQSLACVGQWEGLDPDAVNPQGGAIAIGHPLGASGARLAGSLAWQLHRRGSGTGVASLCIGVGQGLAMVMEAV